MLETKDIIYYVISTLGITVTGIFSYLIWKTTKKSNDISKKTIELSEQTLELTKAVMLTEEQKKKAIKNEYKRIILKNAKEVEKALVIEPFKFDPHRLVGIPNKCGLDGKQLGTYFNEKEVEMINTTWDKLNNYLDEYWPGIKEGQILYGDKYNEAIDKITYLIDTFHLLITNFERE